MSLFSPVEADFKQLEGKVVVLTGGANGIGAATVKLCHAAGASVVFGDILQSEGESLASSLGADRVKFVLVNVTKYADHVKLFQAALDAFGRVDHAFCIAGIYRKEGYWDDSVTIEDVGKEELNPSVIDVNLTGTLYFSRVALPYLRHGGGVKDGKDKSLILMSSVAGFEEATFIPIYSASKHGVLGLMRGISKRNAPARQVRVNAVCPSLVLTDMTASFSDSWINSGLPGQSAEDVAKVVIGLATQDVNGLAVYVQGGKGWDIERGLADTKLQWIGQEGYDVVMKAAQRTSQMLGG